MPLVGTLNVLFTVAALNLKLVLALNCQATPTVKLICLLLSLLLS